MQDLATALFLPSKVLQAVVVRNVTLVNTDEQGNITRSYELQNVTVNYTYNRVVVTAVKMHALSRVQFDLDLRGPANESACWQA